MPPENPGLLHRRLAAALPDIPRWLKARSMLLHGPCEVTGLRERDELSFVARDPEMRLMMVVGRPKEGAIREAAAKDEGLSAVVCQFESGDLVAKALPEAVGGPAALHRLGRAARLPEVPPRSVWLLDEAQLRSVAGLPAELRQELEVGLRRSPLAAAIADGRPASFCYAPSTTEHLWDVSIDTLEPYRRQGHATLCAAFMLRLMRERGLEPVWSAEEGNEASMSLAAKLGFLPMDRRLVFRWSEE